MFCRIGLGRLRDMFAAECPACQAEKKTEAQVAIGGNGLLDEGVGGGARKLVPSGWSREKPKGPGGAGDVWHPLDGGAVVS